MSLLQQSDAATPSPRPVRLVLSLREEVVVERTTGPGLRLQWPGAAPLTVKGAVLGNAVESLSASGATHEELCNRARSVAGHGGAAAILLLVQQLDQAGCLCRTVFSGEARLASLLIFSRKCRDRGTWPDAGHRYYRMSRFAHIRRIRSELVVDSPQSEARLHIHDARALNPFLIAHAPVTPVQLAATMGRDLADAAQLLVRIIVAEGFLTAVVEQSREQHDGACPAWEFADLLFHTATRNGRRSYAWKCFEGEEEDAGGASSASQLRSLGVTVPLPRPAPGSPPVARDPLTEVLAARTSIREYGSQPISLEQLGWFLFFSVRASADGNRHDSFRRPYPSGGSRYSLEVYVVAQSCSGLDRGVYYYNALRHELEVVGPLDFRTDRMLEDCRAHIAGKPEWRAQVLFVVTTRFGRVAATYRRIGYSLVLKELGALYQTMYLVATALKLAPCALGGGDSDLFGEIASLDPAEEASVGEFLLGSRET